MQAEFLLGYRQLIDNTVNSFDDYKEQIAAITVKPRAVTLGGELGRGNYGQCRQTNPFPLWTAQQNVAQVFFCVLGGTRTRAARENDIVAPVTVC